MFPGFSMRFLTLSVLGYALPGGRPPGGEHPLYHPTFSNDSLREEVPRYASWGVAWSTNRTDSSRENRFLQFCLMNRLFSPGGDTLPASEGTLTYFAIHLARTVKHSTIKLYLASVRNLHILCGQGDPVVDPSGQFTLSRSDPYPSTTC